MTFRLWEKLRDWVLLVGCLFVSLVVLLARNEPVVRGMRSASLQATAWVEERFAWAGRYFSALDENERLREDNIELASTVARSREAVLENERLRRMLAFQDTSSVPMTVARIIAKELAQQQNFFTLDVGARDGVEEGMAVVDDRGVLGKVVLVSDRYARVMPYLNTDFRVPARILPSGAEGIVRWLGDRGDWIFMEHVAKTEQIRQGMLVVTSGYSDVFPSGYPVGIVESVASREGRNSLDIYLRPAAPLARTRYAFVLLSRPDPEQTILEQQAVN